MAKPTSPAATQTIPLAGIALLLSLGLFWGLNWPGMKIALNEIPVWWFRVMSVGAGAFGLLVIAFVGSGVTRPRPGEMRQLLICSAFAIVGWHLLTGYGVSLMPAGRASIIAFTMPVWATILGTLMLGERLTWTKIVGLALGVAGLGVLIGPDIAVVGSAPSGAFFMLGASLSWAIGTVLFKKYAWSSPITAVTGWQLLIGAIVITPGAILLEPVPDLTALSTDAIIALIYLFALPMVFCQWAYFKLVRMVPAGIAAISTLAVPVVGVFSSALILGEPVGLPEILAMFLICMALLVVLVVPALGRT